MSTRVTPMRRSRGPGLRDVFAQSDYRRLWAARTVSQWGDVVNTVALSLLVYRLTGSGVGVTGVVVAEIVPVLVLGPFAGAVVDRSRPVRVMVVADIARALLLALLAIRHDSVGLVYAVALATSAATTLFNPASGAVLPTLVGTGRLVAANSGIWTAAVLSQIALAPLAGILVATGGYQLAFALNAVSFVVSAGLLVGLQVGEVPRLGRRALLAQAREGVRVALGDRLLRALAVGQLFAALSAGATSALLVVLAREQLASGSSGYGLLLGAIGVGAAAGPLLLLRIVREPARPRFVFGSFALRGVVDLGLALTTSVPLAAGILVLYGLGTSTGSVTFSSLVQGRPPPQVRGRVLALMDILWQGGRLVSLGVGAALADAVGIAAVYALGGVLLLLAAGVGATASRRGSAAGEVRALPD